MNIHPTAIISKKAKLAPDIDIGPYVIIEEGVTIGGGVKIYAYAQILSYTTIGSGCQIHMGAVLGHQAQMRKQLDSDGGLLIGNNNIFREYVTVHRSTLKENKTIIGDNNYLMAFSHIAHDCCLGNQITICNGALIAGHVSIDDCAFISGNVTVHQFCRIGKLTMIGGLSRVAKDVPPYMLVKGDSCVWAINSVGLKRANFSLSERGVIKKAFKILYRSGLNVKQALELLNRQEQTKEIRELIGFVLKAKRGICGYKRPSIGERIAFSGFIAKLKQIPAYRLFKKSLRFKYGQNC